MFMNKRNRKDRWQSKSEKMIRHKQPCSHMHMGMYNTNREKGTCFFCVCVHNSHLGIEGCREVSATFGLSKMLKTSAVAASRGKDRVTRASGRYYIAKKANVLAHYTLEQEVKDLCIITVSEVLKTDKTRVVPEKEGKKMAYVTAKAGGSLLSRC